MFEPGQFLRHYHFCPIARRLQQLVAIRSVNCWGRRVGDNASQELSNHPVVDREGTVGILSDHEQSFSL